MKEPTTLDEFPQLMTVPQVCKVFQVSDQTVREWCMSGILKNAIKPGRQWRIPKDSVLALINQQHG